MKKSKILNELSEYIVNDVFDHRMKYDNALRNQVNEELRSSIIALLKPKE